MQDGRRRPSESTGDGHCADIGGVQLIPAGTGTFASVTARFACLVFFTAVKSRAKDVQSVPSTCEVGKSSDEDCRVKRDRVR